MRKFITITIIALLSTPSFAAKPPADVNIVNQPVGVTGTVNANINSPVTVTGAVNATVTNPVTVNGTVNADVNSPVDVTNPTGQSLTVTIDPASQEALSHLGRSIDDNIQFQATSYPLTYPEVVEASWSPSIGGGGPFALATGKCLIITEVEIEYISATAGYPDVGFHFGLTDVNDTDVSSIRKFVSIPDSDGRGSISKTFPSGLVLKVSPTFPTYTRLGLDSSNARVINFGASGYTMNCN